MEPIVVEQCVVQLGLPTKASLEAKFKEWREQTLNNLLYTHKTTVIDLQSIQYEKTYHPYRQGHTVLTAVKHFCGYDDVDSNNRVTFTLYKDRVELNEDDLRWIVKLASAFCKQCNIANLEQLK